MRKGYKYKNVISFLASLACLVLFFSCEREPVAPPEPEVNYITIRQLRDIYAKGSTKVDTSVYIQGIITLTPEFGNVPSFISYIQDSTDAICITVSDAENTLAMDSEVRILCNGVSFTNYNGLLQFGDISINSQIVPVNLTAGPPEPDTVTIADLMTGTYQGRYIYLSGVQFVEPGSFSGNNVLTDCLSDIEVYTRSAAVFAPSLLPDDNGSLKGISSVYNDQQILLRDPSELNMTGQRCNTSGTLYLNQDFNSIARYADVSTLTGWLTYSQSGTKTWYGNIVSGKGTWVQATAFQSNQASVVT